MAESSGKEKASRKRTFTSHRIDDILGTVEPRQTRVSTRLSPSSEETGSSDSSGQKNIKKKRMTYTKQQKDALESYFYQDSYPDTQARENMSEALGITPEKVQVWFQNRRAKCRKRELPLRRSHQQWCYPNPEQYALMVAQQQALMTPPPLQASFQPIPTNEEQPDEATATEASTSQ
ncbi:PREDICTED: short stature homeobox protein 2-like [Amphimedon queenslandica]|uniref:Homeobox domain-containing protein n=1 Tax=Amphimedon queenslandica TaxID=400682 RepID=A0A1X7VPD0_AMPQE|nr:PREDICTED: short stature homeobox protein 2-like [Amphimedon queenslandica]|eukprot:XP_011408017.1 PREDICTED: short stature homeobox protein 2-like [Amphimedon queenslandica]